jgi:hypothetical protein
MEALEPGPVHTSSSTINRVVAASAVTAMTAGSAFVWYFNPSNVSFFPVCPLYSLTGLACPGCGLTRGFHALFHGDILTALDYNAMIPAYAAFFGYLFISMLLLSWRGRGLSMSIFKLKWAWGFIGLAFVFTVLRNLPYYPFNVLYP